MFKGLLGFNRFVIRVFVKIIQAILVRIRDLFDFKSSVSFVYSGCNKGFVFNNIRDTVGILLISNQEMQQESEILLISNVF